MRQRLRVAVLGGVLGFSMLGLGAPAVEAAPATRTMAGRYVVLQTKLTYAETVPAGDPDGSGDAVIVVTSTSSVCFRVIVHGIGPILAVHIHEAPPGKQGPHAIDLFGQLVALADGGQVFAGCVAGEPKAAEVAAHPAGFYMNVHTREFVLGAVRGQLGA